MMEWLTDIFFNHSVVQAVTVIALVCAIGLFLGKIKILGISLGVTFVFFVGILAGHIGITIDPQMLNYAENFGLILFIYALGLQVGPSFFSSLGKSSLKFSLQAFMVIFLGSLMMMAFFWTTDISLPDLMGIQAGAVTNTPMLGAAQQTMLQMDPAADTASLALGCAVTYPLGVVGVILASIILRKMFPHKVDSSTEAASGSSKTVNSGFLVTNPEIFGKSVLDVARMAHRRFVISRVWHEGKVVIPTAETIVYEGDRLLLVGSECDMDHISALIGTPDETDWNSEKIDWNAIDSNLHSRRIIVTKKGINGKKLGALRLRNTFGINITRVHRSGIVLLPDPHLTLQMGDRITVVGEEPAIKNVESLLGNAVKDLDEPNLVAVFMGMVLGLLLGSIPIAIPGISFPVKLGLAGGPIVMGILVGAFGPRVHMVTYTTSSANQMLRGLGLSMYLGCLGIDSGANFFDTVLCGDGLIWVSIGFAITLVPVLIVGAISMLFMKTDYASTTGMLCGSMANPMALNYVNSTIEGDKATVAYATVYPLTMFVRVVLAQLMLMIFI